MGKKIVILNGSPRKNGNTSELTAFSEKEQRKMKIQLPNFFLAI